MFRIISFLLLFAVSSALSYCQPADSILNKPLNKKALSLIFTSEAIIYTGTMISLNEAWYKNYPKSSFHFFDDSKEWLQVDKVAHSFTSYHTANFGYLLFKQAGMEENKAIAISGIQSVFFISSIEIFDGFSKEWGASWYDLSANIAGTGLFTLQQYFWKEQKINLKYSYSNSGLAGYRPSALGNNFPEKLIKDYNAQTFWLSANLKSILNLNKFPTWLNIAIGYGADGMLAGHSNDEIQNLNLLVERKRQYYLSLDIDLTRIKVKNKALSTAFKIINVLKFPFPTIEFSSNKLYFHPVFY